MTMDLGTDWVAEMEWPEGVTSGGPGVLIIRPSDPESYPHGGISSTVVREVDFREAVETLRRQLAVSEWRDQKRDELTEASDDRIRDALADGVTDEYLSLLSSRYVRITGQGQSHPIRTLADITGRTESSVRSHLWQAKRRDLLKGSAGRAGGVLTAKAQEVLRQEQASRSAP